ncbi:AbrB/MazE/SpoVT family DNA-binding domain-containing protein [Halosegnis marinus]|uniref:AbrB/MazE/SpoVT family DNA-binding domain-containing protein n=1 Tax=Halosegnis marinus TaxID=3034023 RepID=A0ABD5ZRH2_9EURY|nr:AbrB/MazE/SpoVT family DNA-binding domain-containing protein [Halosegnis sp. DT85]
MATDSEAAWPPATLLRGFQEAGEQAFEQQTELMRRLLAPPGMGAGMPGMAGGSLAAFKTRVQSGGRLSIPDAEREALGIEEGDIVQAFVVPLPGVSERAE